MNDTLNSSLNSTTFGTQTEVTNSTNANTSYSAKIIQRINESLAARKNISNLSIDGIAGTLKGLNIDENKNIDESGFTEVKKHGRKRMMANLQFFK